MLRYVDDENEFEIKTNPTEKKKKIKRKLEKVADKSEETKEILKPAWFDETEQFDLTEIRAPSVLDVHKKAAQLIKEADSDSDSEYDSKTFKILKERLDNISNSTSISIRRLPDANRERLCSSIITSVKFNPKFKMLLTASRDTTLAIFKVEDGKCSILLDRIFEKFPLVCANFNLSGTRVYMTSETNSFRVYDLESSEEIRSAPLIGGKYETLHKFELSPTDANLGAFVGQNGVVYLVDLRSMEKCAVMRCTGHVESICFSSNGLHLFTFCDRGNVFVFDMRGASDAGGGSQGRLVNRWHDDGCTKPSSIAASVNSQWIACGSETGYVNIYSYKDTLMKKTENEENSWLKPVHTVPNLTTAADSLCFHPSGELLCLASSTHPSSVRMMYTPPTIAGLNHPGVHPWRVFANFPSNFGQLDRVTSMAFSPEHGGLLALGQNNGHVALASIGFYAGKY